MPVFGMYFPKVEDVATRTKSTDNTALIILIGVLEHEEQTKAGGNTFFFQMFKLRDQRRNSIKIMSHLSGLEER